MRTAPKAPSDQKSTPAAEPGPIEPSLPGLEERHAQGKVLRTKTPRSAHAAWSPPRDRADPIALLEESNQPRIQDLVPIRYGRMLGSPFAYLRGSPLVMAHDLAHTPVSGIQVQLSGDAHLMNFGVYASPERNLLFDLNDFDETHPGPWEWDLKRLSASLVVAGRSYSKPTRSCVEAARACTRSYREHILAYSRMRLLDVWYSRVDAEAALELFRGSGRKVLGKDLNRARRRNSLQALSRLASTSNGRLHLVDDPPLLTHVNNEELVSFLKRGMHAYLDSLQEDRRTLVQRYRLVDFALKVVGVGSVGTRCYVVLLDASHSEDPLLLQIKEARVSILAEAQAGRAGVTGVGAHAGVRVEPIKYRNQGHRVVSGQRLMQSASDIFLGWTSEGGHDYYVRQLRDMKGQANLETMSGGDLVDYALLCGWVLARAHARSGDPAQIAGYLGKSDVFDETIATFAVAYADQNERDYDRFQEAVASGRLHAEPGV